ncbi:MAG: hypothetical protein ACT4NY_30980 [Pseudonocardiales bacterium]
MTVETPVDLAAVKAARLIDVVAAVVVIRAGVAVLILAPMGSRPW